MQPIRVGKVKKVYDVDDHTLEFEFTNHISVFDKIIPTDIPYKGEVLCRTAAFWFHKLEAEGIRTHFKSLKGCNRMLVKKVRVISDYSQLDGNTTDYLIPLEFIARHYNAGSLNDRVKEGEIAPEKLGYAPGVVPTYGQRLPRPYFECTTKLEPIDRNLSDEEAKKISGLSQQEYDEVFATIMKIDGIMEKQVAKSGLIHVDGKKEFGYDEERRLMILDTFGTLDEDRWWDAAEYAKGKTVELSKEVVRQYYRDIGYHEQLYKMRKMKLPEPDIPPLPKAKAEEVSQLYIALFERMTGEKFR
ncbi:MAG: phosphoribosylaminoimidazolesuccinocarboxamide synthase [Methanomassiliicoccales archaeon]